MKLTSEEIAHARETQREAQTGQDRIVASGSAPYQASGTGSRVAKPAIDGRGEGNPSRGRRA